MPVLFNVESLDIPFDSHVHAVLARCPDIERLRFQDEEYLIIEGDESQDIFLVLRGSYVVEQDKGPGDARGKAVAVHSADPDSPSYVGEMAYLERTIRSASIRCSGAVFALKLEPRHVNALIDEFPAFTRVLVRQLAERLRDAGKALQTLQDRFSMDARQVFAKPGEILIAQGTPAESLYQLVDGEVVKDGGSRAERIRPQGTNGEFLNARAYFRSAPNDATFRAKTEVICVAIARASRESVIRSYPALAIDLLR